MTVEQLRGLYSKRPFQPFRVHLADGRSLDVEHPEFMAFSQSGRTVIISKSDDSSEIVDLLLVTSLEVLNGRTKTGRRKS
jgi:hypothetical protein